MAKKNKMANMTPAERAACLRAQKKAEIEAKKKKIEMLKQYLTLTLDKEESACRENTYKINHRWRLLMREAKKVELCNDLEILHQTFERIVDRKDNIFKTLNQEIEESEEQYMMSLRNQLNNLDLLIELQNQQLERMKHSFDEELNMMKREFDAEKIFMASQHQNQIDDLKDLYVAFDKHFLSKEIEARNEFCSTRDELKNKSLDDKHSLHVKLECKVDSIWAEFVQCQANYNRSTEERRVYYEMLKTRDEQSTREIERQMLRLQNIATKVTSAKSRMNKVQDEYEEKNRLLREEREKLGIHFLGLKSQINQLHEKEHIKLTKMVNESDVTQKKVKELNKQAEQIIALAESCRKLETEEEKVLPFYTSCLSLEEEHELSQMKGTMEDEIVTKLIKRYEPLEMFWKRFNKVQLDRLVLLKEKDILNNENENLKCLLAQYLNGLSINSDIISQPNSLLVVNGRSNLNLHPAIKDDRVRPVPMVKLEAAHIVKDGITSRILK